MEETQTDGDGWTFLAPPRAALALWSLGRGAEGGGVPRLEATVPGHGTGAGPGAAATRE